VRFYWGFRDLRGVERGEMRGKDGQHGGESRAGGWYVFEPEKYANYLKFILPIPIPG
jgi:hypothetical protein